MKKIIKKYISSLLVASMGFSLLAPALAINAQAEETDFLSKRGTISFDLGIYKTFKEHEDQIDGKKYLLDPVLEYNKGDKSKTMQALGIVTAEDQKRRKYEVLFAKKGGTDQNYFTEYIEDTGKNNQDKKSVNIPKNTVEMPWWNFDWKDFDRKISEYQSHIDVTHITFPNVYEQPDLKPWNGVKYHFPGYVLEKWYDKSDITQTPVNKLPLEFPYVSTTYVAKFKSDGYRYTLTTKHVPAREGINPPINHVDGHENGIINDDPLEDDKQVKLDTDQSYQMRPVNIPGYKASLDDSDIKITDPRSDTPDKNFNVPYNSYNKIYAWTKDSDNNLGGQVFNKNVEATYKYDVDESQKFYVIVKHIRKAQDGSILNTTVDKYPFAAETDLSTKNIVPKAEYIKPKEVGGKAPYLLEKGVLEGPLVKSGTVANESTHLSGLKEVDGKNFDTDGRLIGKMPNQNVIIEYTYKPNPAYKLNINVRYEDGNGRSITKKVLEQKRTDGVDYYEPLGVDSSGIVNVLLAQNTKTNIPLPELQGYEEPNVVITSNVTLAGTAEKDMPNHILKLTMANTSYDIKVVYTQKAQDFGKLIFDTGDHLKLKFDDRDYDPNQDFIYLDKDSEGNLIIPKSISENEDMKKLKADSALGYDLEGFYAQDGDKEIRLLNEKKLFINQEPSVDAYMLKPIKGDTYRLRAKAKKRSTDVKKWFNIEFEYKPGENNDVTVDNPKTSLSFYPYINNDDNDITKIAFNLKAFKELADTGEVTAEHGTKIHVPFEGGMPNIEVPEHYKLKWYDGDSDREIEENRLLDYDRDFYDRRFKLVARVVKDQPLQFNKPEATSAINTYTGHIKMIVNQLNPDPLVKYVLTDESGNVIYKTTSEKLAEAKKTIENENIIPGRKYKLYEIAPGYKVPENLMEHTDIRKSEPCEVLAKIAGDPIFLANENDKVDTTFEDLHPGMQYALRKKDGTLVSDWQRPQDKKLTFKALDPDEEYELIVKAPSENFDVTQAPKGFEFRTKLETGIYKLIIANGENQKYIKEAKQILEDGSEVDVDLNNIKPGTTLIIKVQPFVDGLSFQSNGGIKLRYGNPEGFSSFNNECKFTMPRSNVMLELIYANVNANASFEEPTIKDYQGHQEDIAPTNPIMDEDGTFKVEFDRKKATVSEAQRFNIPSQDGKKFKPIDILKARLLKKTNNDEWIDYDMKNSDGSKKTIRTNIMTGGLEKKNREYKLFRLTSSGTTDEQSISEDSLMHGYFAKNFENNELYLFGYYESELYKLKIIDLKDNSEKYRVDINASEYHALSDFQSEYADILPQANSTYVSPDDGITHTYKGLSTSRDSFESPEADLPIKGNMSLYIFYDDDREKRQEIESELENLLGKVENRLDNNELKQAYDNAKRTVDNKTPRKATTGDLQLAYNKLRQALGLPNNGDSSGGSGGSGSGGSGGSGGHGGFAGGRNNPGAGSLGFTYKGYSVGRDGNWKLLDKDKHIWIFELNDGQRIKGWANLSYTYNAVRRVETYHFAADGVMDYGWFLDENGDWYYMSELHDGFFGHMVRSWYKDDKDGHWYYLSEKNGKMLKAWQKIGGIWYYLNPQNQTEPTWSFDAQKQKWIYIGNTQIRPLGSMYKNERTPDNYYVNDSGAWVEGK